MAASVIRNFIAKGLFKKKGAIANNKAVEFSANALELKLINLGINPNLIKSEQELNQILSFVKQAEDRAFQQNFGDMLGGSKFDRKGEVFDMTGKKINTSKGIMGGKEINEQTLKEGLMKTDNPFSDLVNTPRPKTLAEREAEVLARMEKENKEAVERIRERKRLEDLEDPEDMAQGGRAGYKFGLGPLFNFLNKKSPAKAYTDYLKSVKDRMKAGKEAEVAGEVIPIAATGALITNQLKKKLKAMNEEQKKKIREEAQEELREDMKKADGGRIGYAEGTPELKLYPRASGRQIEGEVGPGFKISERDLNYGITGLLEGDKFFGGAELDKGKVKIDVVNPEGDTLFKDTIGKEDAVNFILGMGDPKGEKFQIKTDKDFENIQLILRKSFAQGGRIGLAKGMTKRAFLKLMGGVGAGIGALKTGLLGFGKGAATKQVAKEAIEQGVKSTPPPYFFELASKIKTLGKPDKVTYADRVEIHRYTGKNGDEYELIEDLNTGDVRITKDKTGMGSYNDKTFDTIEDRTVLEYKKGDADIDPETGTAFKSADEYEEYKVEFDADGTPADATELDAVVQKEIIEEAGGEAPSIKKAGGGIARMLGE